VTVTVIEDPTPYTVITDPETEQTVIDGPDAAVTEISTAGQPGLKGDPGEINAAAPLTYDPDTQTLDITLAGVATSGAYEDLSGTPTLGTAAGADITAFDAAGTAAAGDATEASARIAADTALASSVTAETNRATATEALKANTADLAEVATSGDYADLSGTPSLAPVATTGAYSDLMGKPTLGTAAAADSTAFDASGAASAAQAASQPLDSDLTAIAAISAATAGALVTDGAGWIRKTYAQLKAALGLVKGDVGLGNVDNTSDANKPISTVTQTALDTKAVPITHRTLQMMITPAHVYQGTWIVANATTSPGGSIIFNLSGAATGDAAGVDLDLTPGTWTLSTWNPTGPAFGIVTYDISYDGGANWTNLTSAHDCYAAAAGAKQYTKTGLVVPTGTTAAILRIKTTAKNASAAGFVIGIAQLGLLRTAAP
jgi:hypothetical protein